jgi:hypothetical protein
MIAPGGKEEKIPICNVLAVRFAFESDGIDSVIRDIERCAYCRRIGAHDEYSAA